MTKISGELFPLMFLFGKGVENKLLLVVDWLGCHALDVVVCFGGVIIKSPKM